MFECQLSLVCLFTSDCCQPAFVVLTVVRLLSGTLGPREEELYVGTEPVYEEEQDQGHFAEQGKPPQHPTEILLILLKCFVFKIK